jgi:hypothetical protein
VYEKLRMSSVMSELVALVIEFSGQGVAPTTVGFPWGVWFYLVQTSVANTVPVIRRRNRVPAPDVANDETEGDRVYA